MHKVITLIIFLIVILITQVTAQQITVESINYPAEFVAPTGIIKVALTAEERGNIRYIVQDSGAIHFCSDDFQVISTRPITDVTIIQSSKKGKYLLLNEYIEIPERYSPEGLIRQTLIDYKGNILFTKEESYYWDQHKNIARCVSDLGGNLFEYTSSTSTLRVYGPNGETLNSYTLFDDPIYREVHMDISDEGNVVAIIAPRRYPSRARKVIVKRPRPSQDSTIAYEKKSGEPYLFLLNNDGSLRAIIPLKEEGIGPVAVGPQGNIILASVQDIDIDFSLEEEHITYAYTSNGELLFSIPHICNNALVTDSHFTITYYDRPMRNYFVSTFNRTDGALLSSIQVSKSPKGIISISGISDVICIIVKSGQELIDDYSFFIYKNGTKLHEFLLESLPFPSIISGTWAQNKVFSSSAFINSTLRNIQIIKALKK